MVQRSEQSTDDLFLFALSDDFGSDDAYDVELHLQYGFISRSRKRRNVTGGRILVNRSARFSLVGT